VETLKIKVGHQPPKEAGSLLEAIREAVGPHIRLRLDANRAWTLEEAVQLLSQWRRLALECVEEPLRLDCMDQLPLLRDLGIPLVADESLRSRADLEQLSGGFEGVVLKPLLIGGLYRSVQMARDAAARGLFVIVTTAIEAAVGRLGVAHVAAACPREAQRAHGLGTGILLGEDLVEGEADPGIQGGRYTIFPSPGLGLSLGQLRTEEAA
jgi:O-succinylbenzoate synthase